MHFILINGDFFTEMKTISAPVDLILTDPPYNVLDDIHQWDQWLDLRILETEFSKVLSPFGLVLVFCDIRFMVRLMNELSNELSFKHYHIWKKPGGMPISKNRPINNAEFILIFQKQNSKERETTFNPDGWGVQGVPYRKRNSSPDVPIRRMKKGKVNTNETGMRFPKTIIEAPGKPNMKKWERSNHPTQKPELLLRKLIRLYSNRGDLILDPFAGCGSTIISAYKENRRGIGFEIEKDYYQEAKQRIEAVINQGELFS